MANVIPGVGDPGYIFLVADNLQMRLTHRPIPPLAQVVIAGANRA